MIYIIEGSTNQEKLDLANAIRNGKIAQGKGALLVDENNDGEPRHLLEKIIDGTALPNYAIDATELPWKPDAVVVLIGSKETLLDTFEQIVPGFVDMIGPVFRLSMSSHRKKWLPF